MADLFYCYLRLGQPKKMQLLAVKLYKLTGRAMFVFWSVSSMTQQSDLPPAMLTVAERMIEKVFNEGTGAAHAPGKHVMCYGIMLYGIILSNRK